MVTPSSSPTCAAAFLMPCGSGCVQCVGCVQSVCVQCAGATVSWAMFIVFGEVWVLGWLVWVVHVGAQLRTKINASRIQVGEEVHCSWTT